MKKQYIETGIVTGTHGIRGGLRVQPWCDSPQDLTGYQKLYLTPDGSECLNIIEARVHKQMVLLTCKGVDSVEAAEALRGRTLYLDRKQMKLENGQYLVVDLIGCRVLNASNNAPLGEISDVSRTGANDVWHIQRDGKEYLIPAVPSVVDRVDVDAGEVHIIPLKGIFEDAD